MPTDTNPPLVRVCGLAIEYMRPEGSRAVAVDDVNLDIAPGEFVGLVGESGCGKTTLGHSLLRLLPDAARVASGAVIFHDLDLLQISGRQLEKIRGNEISLISQEPALALNPVMRVGNQVAEVIRAHRPWSWRRCRDEALEIFEQLGLGDSGRIFSAYPHQLSGGQRQRIAIAQAVACRPALVIADEPTTALDPAVQAEILLLFQRLRAQEGTAFLVITHDPTILAGIADRVLVMYAGRIVEECLGPQFFQNPLHPYAQGLLLCLSGLLQKGNFKSPLPTIPGSPPDPAQLPEGCRFHPRCPEKMEICPTRIPATTSPEAHHKVRCFKYGG